MLLIRVHIMYILSLTLKRKQQICYDIHYYIFDIFEIIAIIDITIDIYRNIYNIDWYYSYYSWIKYCLIFYCDW